MIRSNSLFLLVIAFSSNTFADIIYAEILCAQSKAKSTIVINERIKEFTSRPLKHGEVAHVSAPGMSNWNSENRICVTSSVRTSTVNISNGLGDSIVLCAADKARSEVSINQQIATTISKSQSSGFPILEISQPAQSNWNSENRICVTLSY
ncbi:MAG: hypothetical protein SGJ18_03720 [Pseudomonadota bacterium]|nr:hypothetical protein [Pseudomonadota bacterium]